MKSKLNLFDLKYVKKKKYFITILFAFLISELLIISPSYSQLVHDFKVNDDTNLSIPKYEARISTNKNGISVIVWKPSGLIKNIYAQMYNTNFLKINNNFPINSQPDSILSPDVIIRNDGYFGVVWHKNGALYSRTFFRLFNKDGNPITSDIQLNDSLSGFNGYPKIGCDSVGRFIVVWEYTNYDIYFQMLDSIGNKIGANVKVNEGNTCRGSPDILVRKDGSFIIAWEDNRTPGSYNCDVYMQIYDKNGNPIGTNQRVNDNLAIYDKQSSPKLSQDSSGNFTVAFKEYILDYNRNYIRYQRYDKNGIKIGQNKSLPATSSEMLMSSFDSDEEGNLVFQMDRNNATNYYVYNLRIDKNDNPIGTYFPVSNEYIESGKGGEDIKLNNKRIINVWRDIRLSTQPQIFANVRSFINPDSTVGIIGISNEVPQDFMLYQNYPNPFNPITNIKYQITNNSFVSLRVYDVIGKEVATLVNEKQKRGLYEVQFSINQYTNIQITTGMYFYSLFVDGNRIDTKKFVYLK